MARSLTALTLVLGLLASGCQSAYSSIVKLDDASYQVTRNKQGFFSASGTLWNCQKITELKMQCVLASEP